MWIGYQLRLQSSSANVASGNDGMRYALADIAKGGDGAKSAVLQDRAG